MRVSVCVVMRRVVVVVWRLEVEGVCVFKNMFVCVDASWTKG